MVWEQGSSLAARFGGAGAVLAALLGHQRGAGKTYQGWVKASVRWSPRLLGLIGPHLQRSMQTISLAGGRWITDGWVLFGCDGTRLDAPRTAANEKAFGCGGKKKTGPQLWLTALVHLGSGLPWAWKIGKADASERAHLRQMIHLLPERALLIADAGYTGYELWRRLIDSGRSILIRVGANVRLLRQLGYQVGERDEIVYLWPDKQRQCGQRPLVLRLIRLHDGRKEVFLITNVLDPAKLSDAQAAKFYRLRWGLELWFRAMKQTMQRRKLLSRTPVRAALELRWMVVGLACLGLLQVRALLEKGINPHRGSTAGALRVVRAIMRHPLRRFRRGQDLSSRLGHAILDDCRRKASKAARDWPHPKKQRPPGGPKLRLASAVEIHAAQRLPRHQAA